MDEHRRRDDKPNDASNLAIGHMYLCGATLATEGLLWIARKLQPDEDAKSTCPQKQGRVRDALAFTSGVIMPGHDQGSLRDQEVYALRQFLVESPFGLENIGMSRTSNAPERFIHAVAQFELLCGGEIPSEEAITTLTSFFSVLREYCLKKHERVSRIIALV